MFCKYFEIKKLEEHHDLYVEGNTLLLAEVFENCQNMCPEIYEFNPACFSYCTRFSVASSLKRTKVKLDILTDIEILLMAEKSIRGGICHYDTPHSYAKANKKYMKDYDKNKESTYLKY